MPDAHRNPCGAGHQRGDAVRVGVLGASQIGYRPLPAAVIGIAGAALGLLVVLANALLK
jgi:hypothetical protein